MGEPKDNNAIQLFEDKQIRTAWDAEQEEWYFSIVDVISVLTGTENPRRYWSDLKRKLKTEGAVEVYEKIVQLKMTAPDGKKRLTDVADTEQLLRIIQSVPSPKAEPFKAWLAMVGRKHHIFFNAHSENQRKVLFCSATCFSASGSSRYRILQIPVFIFTKSDHFHICPLHQLKAVRPQPKP